jgi:Mg2+ and Co2+ transporter CorA
MADIKIIQLTQPTAEQLAAAIADFESTCGHHPLHPAAVRGLSHSDERQISEPFPKVESHGTYVFGMFATPTDISDAKSEYFNVHFVVNEHAAITVLWGPPDAPGERLDALRTRIAQEFTDNVPENAPGDVVVQIADVVIEDLESVLWDLRLKVSTELEELESELFDETTTINNVNSSEKHQKASLLKFEILSMKTTVEETKNALTSIVHGGVDLGPDENGHVRPPFSPNQQIWFNDLLMRSRSIKAQRTDLEDEIKLVYDRLESLENQRQTIAQMRLGAVASILLLPALIVGFFGQNFNVTPWDDFKYSWEINAAVLFGIAAVQFVYFKRKKWL